MVGLIPRFAVEVLDASVFARLPGLSARMHWFLKHRPHLAQLVSRWRDARRLLHLGEIAVELARRLCRIFQIDEFGNRAVFGGSPIHRHDPRFRDHLLFYEYLHGDTERGIGAAHQTRWTGLIAALLERGWRTSKATPAAVPLAEPVLAE
jgi:hypothetical protein